MRSDQENSNKRIIKEKPNVTAGEKWVLRLYIAGQTPKAINALENLQKICEEKLAGKYTIEVIDLLKNPQLSRNDQIIALPTLVKRLPLPLRRIIGDMSNKEKILLGLDLKEVKEY
jgi:circadian clock protein KaiB